MTAGTGPSQHAWRRTINVYGSWHQGDIGQNKRNFGLQGGEGKNGGAGEWRRGLQENVAESKARVRKRAGGEGGDYVGG